MAGGKEAIPGKMQRETNQLKLKQTPSSSPSLLLALLSQIHCTPLHPTSEVSVLQGPPGWFWGGGGWLSNSIFLFLFFLF